ncbi:MAG TPA: hypothetical protein VK474_08310, partial [Chthoniobacterales bacterium]|nr:hypothetical protein [Chthoniobacterales bacterium]
SAGGLWRDEAAAVSLASMPSFGEIWAHLEHESFPLLFTMLLRGWSALGWGGSDPGLRVFGLCVGLAVLAALWWNAWRFSSAPPLVSLLLFGLSPVAIRWGDSLRGYGLGVCFILLALGLVGKVLLSPTKGNVALASLAGILAVQTLYQNSYILGAICLSGAAVSLRRRHYRGALLMLALALPAALSLIPYLPVVRRANEWNVVTQMPLSLARIGTVLHRALSDPDPLMFWLWVGLLGVALLVAVISMRRPAAAQETDVTWFLLGVMIFTTAAYYLFLKLAQFPTEVWYYLLWMAVMAVAIDGLIVRFARTPWPRAALSAAALAAAGFMLSDGWQQVEVRMTNVDIIARRLNQSAAPGDLILVHPWFCGATFQRYYRGRAEWTTLPPLNDHALQRLDLFKEQLMIEDPIEPVLEKMETVLRNGGAIWLVGYFPFSNPPRAVPTLPRPGLGPQGWQEGPYMMAYGMQAASFLQRNAARNEPVALPLAQKVNPFEKLPLRVITGWRRAY